MNDKEKRLSFKENKGNEGLVLKLRELAKSANRRLNDYLNIVLSKHVQDHNDTTKE